MGRGLHPRVRRIFALTGPGDVGGTLQRWIRGLPEDRIPAVAFSQQLFELCREHGIDLLVSPNTSATPAIAHGRIAIEPIVLGAGRGARYYWQHLLRGVRASRRARRFRADLCLIGNDLEPIGLLPFALQRGRCAFELHCAMWPRGARGSLLKRLKAAVDRLIVRLLCDRILCVSEECRRQVAGGSRAILSRTSLFLPYYADRLPTGVPPPSCLTPFRIFSAGRIEHDKGVFDILEAAAILTKRAGDEFEWTIAGTGSALGALRAAIRERGLGSVVRAVGQLERQALVQEIIACHATLTPTRLGFAEGLAQLPLESAIIGRPALLSTVVPADDHLPGACVRLPPGNPQAIADAVVSLRDNPAEYAALVAGANRARSAFLSGEFSYKRVVAASLSP